MLSTEVLAQIRQVIAEENLRTQTAVVCLVKAELVQLVLQAANEMVIGFEPACQWIRDIREDQSKLIDATLGMQERMTQLIEAFNRATTPPLEPWQDGYGTDDE